MILKKFQSLGKKNKLNDLPKPSKYMIHLNLCQEKNTLDKEKSQAIC
jgi:hypothetical protein